MHAIPLAGVEHVHEQVEERKKSLGSSQKDQAGPGARAGPGGRKQTILRSIKKRTGRTLGTCRCRWRKGDPDRSTTRENRPHQLGNFPHCVKTLYFIQKLSLLTYFNMFFTYLLDLYGSLCLTSVCKLVSHT